MPCQAIGRALPGGVDALKTRRIPWYKTAILWRRCAESGPKQNGNPHFLRSRQDVPVFLLEVQSARRD